MLFFTVGLFTQIPIFSQETRSVTGQVVREEDFPIVVADPRAGEENYRIGETSGDDGLASSSTIWVVVRMVLVLALAAAAIYGVVYFIKKSTKPSAVSDPFLKILATAHLGSSRYAHIVSVGSKAWLLGSSDGGVNLIGEIDDKDIIDAMLLEDSRKTAEIPSGRFPDFLSMLRRLGTPAESRISGAENIRKRRERLKGL